MISGIGAQMQQGISYTPTYYRIIDQNVGGSGNLWQVLGSGSSTCKIGMVYNVSSESPNSDPGLAYHHKETLRQTMLKQEAVFRNQVHELHRLYSRQKQLMNEVSRNHWQMQCAQSNLIPSQVQYNVFQKAYTPPAPFGGNFQIHSAHIVSHESIRAGSSICIKENSLEEQRIPVSKVCYTKRLLDLQLPAEEYIDSEDEEELKERNPVQMPEVQYDNSQSTSSPNKDTVKYNETSSSNVCSNCSKTTFLFDLNEPIQLDESETPDSADFINSGGADIIIPEDEDSLGKSNLGSHLQNEESTQSVPEGKGNEGSSLTSGIQDLAESSIPPCGDRTSLASEVAKKEGEAIDDNNRSVLHSCITNSCSPALMSSNEAKTEASSSVSSLQTSVCNLEKVPFAIQALPCFNIPDLLSKTSRSSSSNSGIKRKYCDTKGNPAIAPSAGSVSCSSKAGSSVNEYAIEHSSLADCIKKSHCATSSEDIAVVDVMPWNGLPKAEVSQEKHCRTDESSSSDGTNLNENPVSEDFDRIAAETIVSISSSDIQKCLRNLEVYSSDCLSWFANIASSVTSDQEIEFESVRSSPRNNQNIVTGDDNIGIIETTPLKLNMMNLEHSSCPQTTNQNCDIQIHHREEEEGEEDPGRGKKKTRQKKGSLSCIASLDSDIVSKNLQPGEGSSSSRRRRRRRNRKVKIVSSNVCSILKQHTSHELSSTMSSLLGWGSKNRRQNKKKNCHQYGLTVLCRQPLCVTEN